MQSHEHRPRAPAVGSLTSANAEFNRWLNENCHTQLPDALGQIWTSTPSVQILPDPVNKHASIHRLQFDIKTQISRHILLACAVLDMSKDQRLLSLLDDSIITVVYQRPAFETDLAYKLKAQAAEDLIKIRKGILNVNLSDLYRAVVGRWVNSRFHMTYPAITSPQIKINLEF